MDFTITGEHKSSPRNTPHHKRILTTSKIPGTKSGHNLGLECGHKVQTFGDLTHLNGVVLCQECALESSASPPT